MTQQAPFGGTPADFLDLGPRDSVDKVLQRLTSAGAIRRMTSRIWNRLTQQLTGPDYRESIATLEPRDQVRMLIDGMKAANDPGLKDAVPAHVVVHTDLRRRSIHVGNLTIEFKMTAPSRLYWVDRPAMQVAQALYWLKDVVLMNKTRMMHRLRRLLADPTPHAVAR